VAHEFRRLWERHDPRGKALEQKRFYHRDVGELTKYWRGGDHNQAELAAVWFCSALESASTSAGSLERVSREEQVQRLGHFMWALYVKKVRGAGQVEGLPPR
jgi:hypothetical protein